MTTPPALVVRGLEASYGTNQVLRGVDLTVTAGVTAILGSSGCGKTTLLRTVAGFVQPSAGSVSIAGREVVGGARPVPARRRKVGYVPQEGALFPHLNVAGNVAFGLPRTSRRGGVSDVVARALELVEIDPAMATRYPHELSGGQQQRVALARALAPGPSLVLLDEPFSSLDASLREETGRSVIRALRAAGAAAVLVTHDQGEALSLADQVAVMVEGQFLQTAAPTDIYLAPADPRVAAFLGNASLLPGEVRATGLGRCALGEIRLHGDLATGPARFAVRSEQVVISAAESVGEPAADAVAGEVVDVSFFGHDATVRVRLTSGEQITARTPADSVPHAGDRVTARVVGEVVAFPA